MNLRVAHRPGRSALHRLHPLIKGAWLLFGTVFVFVVPCPWAVAGALAVILLAFPLCGLRLGEIRGRLLIGSTAALLAVLQLVFVQAGTSLFDLGWFSITDAGLERAIYIAGRFVVVIALSLLFVLTTDPSRLAHAMVRAGLPYRYGFTLVTALRLVAVFEQEAATVYRAQLARGVPHDARGPGKVLSVARRLLLPLLVSALGKVDALAISMEGRCFGRYPERTSLSRSRFSALDWSTAVLLSAAVGATVVALVLH